MDGAEFTHGYCAITPTPNEGLNICGRVDTYYHSICREKYVTKSKNAGSVVTFTDHHLASRSRLTKFKVHFGRNRFFNSFATIYVRLNQTIIFQMFNSNRTWRTNQARLCVFCQNSILTNYNFFPRFIRESVYAKPRFNSTQTLTYIFSSPFVTFTNAEQVQQTWMTDGRAQRS